MQGLHRDAGDEIIRIAVLGIQRDQETTSVARKLIRAILTDPLSDEQLWETQLDSFDANVPLVIRVGPSGSYGTAIEFARHNPIEELHISSAQYNNLNLEFLVMNVGAPEGPATSEARASLEDALLVPSIDIASAKDRISAMTTPVHKTIVVGDGFDGALNVAKLSLETQDEIILGVANISGIPGDRLGGFVQAVDISQADKAIELFRRGPENAFQFEKLWFASNVPAIATWLKQSAQTSEHQTKPAVRSLLGSLVQSAKVDVETQEAALQEEIATPKMSPEVVAAMEAGLSDWSRAAHNELQEELDKAFSGTRWRKLGWWKLFWRVDDVGMLTNDILSSRFLPTSEQKLVYLAGRVEEQRGSVPLYPQPTSTTSNDTNRPLNLTPKTLPKWPGHITFTRRYLQEETVPALQALAQKLVVQSLGTSTVSTTLAGLLYISSFSTTFYEVGAVAALGIVYGLGRMQKKWEAARDFWEGEVREEGRKAVRGTEESVVKALSTEAGVPDAIAAELEKAKELVSKAEEALSQLK